MENNKHQWDKDYILFDLDGTLTDPKIGITKSVAYALEKVGIVVEDLDLLTPFIGPPLIQSFQELYGFGPDEAKLAIEKYREYFGEKGLFENEVYDGVEDMLSSLRNNNKKLIVATSKPTYYATKILEHFHLLDYFDFVAGSELNGERSKKGEVISYALEQCNIRDKDKVVMIGDRKHDIIGANEIEIDSIGVLYGYGSEKELQTAGATFIVSDISQLMKLL